MSRSAIRATGLRKSFDSKEVLSGIDLEVEAGTIFGTIGPNGAGKTTTVKILTGQLASFEGEARVADLDPRDDSCAVKAMIGYVPEHGALYGALTIAQLLLFVGRLHRLDDPTIRARAGELLEVFGLGAELGTRISTLSKGMRQKLLITAALLHDPKLIFLDEPLSGLDVHASLLVKELLRQLADTGRTIFYCSHMMDVVEQVCDSVAIIDGGEIVARGTPAEIASTAGGGSLEQVFARLTHAPSQEQGVERIVRSLSITEDRGDAGGG